MTTDQVENADDNGGEDKDDDDDDDNDDNRDDDDPGDKVGRHDVQWLGMVRYVV